MTTSRLALLVVLVFAAFAGAAAAADMQKVLHVTFPVAEMGFDPQASSDLHSNYVNRQVFDPLYKYDYVARP